MSSYPLFVALWSAALLVHQALRIALLSYAWFDVAAAALFALGAFIPRAPLVLPIVAVVQLVSLWLDLPAAANHWVLAGFVNVTILGTLFALGIRRQGGELKQEEIVGALGPLVRVQIILVYLIATLHKLNTDFLDPSVGCLGWVAHWLAGRLGIDAIDEFPGIVTATAYLTIAVEAAIPLLLMRRRTWFSGVALGVLFHIANTETGFAAIAIVLYFFFFPSTEPQTIAQGFDDFLRKRSGSGLTLERLIRAYVVLFLLIFPSVPVEKWLRGSAVENWVAPMRSALWIAALVLFCGAILRYFRRTGIPPAVFGRERAASRVLYVVPILLVVNGLAPYLGLKTTTSFDMFSNLRVLGPTSNHLLLRNHPLRIFNRESDLVTVKGASDSSLVRISAAGPFPYEQFRRDVQERVRNRQAPLRIVYERRGRMHYVANAADDPELMKTENVFARKLLPLRREPWRPTSACPW